MQPLFDIDMTWEIASSVLLTTSYLAWLAARRLPPPLWQTTVDATRASVVLLWQATEQQPGVMIELSTHNAPRHAWPYPLAEYFFLTPELERCAAWRWQTGEPRSIGRSAHGQWWSTELEAGLGLWHGELLGRNQLWPRFFLPNGSLVPSDVERERERSSTERHRAERAMFQAEAEREQARQAMFQAEAERERADELNARLVAFAAERATWQHALAKDNNDHGR
jgi:hypothetical protein